MNVLLMLPIGLVFFFILGLTLYLKLHPQFGGTIRANDKIRYTQSKHWDGHKFVNLSTTTMDIDIRTLPKLLYQQFTNTKVRYPSKNLYP